MQYKQDLLNWIEELKKVPVNYQGLRHNFKWQKFLTPAYNSFLPSDLFCLIVSSRQAEIVRNPQGSLRRIDRVECTHAAASFSVFKNGHKL